MGHRHSEFEIGYCHAGSGVFCIGGRIEHFRAGSAVLIPPEVRHYAEASPETSSDWRFWYVDIDRTLGTAVGGPDLRDLRRYHGPGFTACLDPVDAPGLCALVAEFDRECAVHVDGWSDAIRALLWAILVRMRRLRGQDPDMAERRATSLAAIDPALDLINRRYADALTIADLCAVCHCSSSALHRHFRTAIGCSARDFLMRRRVHQAAELLRRSQRSLAAIGAAVGFPSISSLNRQFHRQLGCSPREYRRGRPPG